MPQVAPIIAAVGALASAGAGIAGAVSSAKAGDQYAARQKKAEDQLDSAMNVINQGEKPMGLTANSLGSNSLGTKSLIEPQQDFKSQSLAASGPRRGALSGSTNFGRG